MKTWKELVVAPNASILDVLKLLEEKGTQFALVLDKDKLVLGTITDGDIRRGLMKKLSLESDCQTIMNTNFHFIKESSRNEVESKKFRELKIKFIPVLDDNGRLITIESFEDLAVAQKRESEVLVLAGGLGSRLGDLTKSCPKPLLKVGNAPILESIILSLKSSGFYRVNISVNYLSQMIEDYFGDGSKWGIKIEYIKESKRLGTAGPLSLLNKRELKEPVVVLNGDLVTDVDFGVLLDFHKDQENLATMCVRRHEERVPYGVVEFENLSLRKIVEKPVNYYHVNAGIYVFSPPVINFVPSETYFDMNNLFETLIDEKHSKIGVFPIHEYWVDVGQPGDLSKARREF